MRVINKKLGLTMAGLGIYCIGLAVGTSMQFDIEDYKLARALKHPPKG